MSVDWSEKRQPSETYDFWKQSWGKVAVGQLTAQSCYDAAQKLDYAPFPDNEAHTNVVGNKSSRKVRRRLGDACDIIIPGP